MFQLSSPEPVTKTLINAVGDRQAVAVTFNAQPSPLSLRYARLAVATAMRDFEGRPDRMQRAADAFTVAIIRHNIVSWSGIGDAQGDAIEPTHDRERTDDDGNVTGVELGTISAFLAEPRLVEAADREYVIPWTDADREKNGSSASVSGTTAAATPERDTANSAADTEPKGDAAMTTPAPQPALTTPKPVKPKRGKRSGS
ncbi:hypothetical protein [Sphingomonas sp. DC2300-3]|uniref:hypothetical protein n=1 Tax=unclassified Sphingomonas TaxID=196159 RepID=UPI003CF9318E